MNKEIISIHIGQAGAQIGETCWELFCKESDINYRTGSGVVDQQKDEQLSSSLDNEEEKAFQKSFFSETRDGKWKSRALFIDLDSESIDKMRLKNSMIHDEESLLCSNENAGNNFAKGRGVGSNLLLENCLERIKKMVGECDAFEGFLITSALNGGSGSGFRDLLMERISTEFEKKRTVGFDIIGSVSSSVDPYNIMLGMNSLREYSDASIILENEALINICKNKLNVDFPKMRDLNELVSYCISSSTISIRKKGYLNMSFEEIISNLIPYPSVKYIVHSMSPIYSKDVALYSMPSATELTRSCFLDPNSVMATCNLLEGKFMASTIQYTGHFVPKDIGRAVADVKTNRLIKFVDWCPTGFKCGIHYEKPVNIVGGNFGLRTLSTHALSNSTSISQIFTRMETNFDCLFSEKAFVHWYLEEGFEEEEFIKCREEIKMVQQDYSEIDKTSEE